VQEVALELAHPRGGWDSGGRRDKVMCDEFISALILHPTVRNID
jgi:hypothetical protein